jgi:hypothetical protein
MGQTPTKDHSISTTQQLKRSDAITAALLADIYKATTTLQDIPMMPSIARLAPEASMRLPKIDALEPARVLAFVVVLKLSEYLIDSLAPLVRK